MRVMFKVLRVQPGRNKREQMIALQPALPLWDWGRLLGGGSILQGGAASAGEEVLDPSGRGDVTHAPQS